MSEYPLTVEERAAAFLGKVIGSPGDFKAHTKELVGLLKRDHHLGWRRGINEALGIFNEAKTEAVARLDKFKKEDIAAGLLPPEEKQ